MIIRFSKTTGIIIFTVYLIIFLAVILSIRFGSFRRKEAGEDISKQLLLAKDGQTKFAIYTESDKDPIVMHAAKELAQYLKKITGERILIAGNSSRGTLYGVYYFLDRLCGVRWFSPDYTYIPKKIILEFAPLNINQTPRFVYRELFVLKADDEQFRAYNLLNGKSHYR